MNLADFGYNTLGIKERFFNDPPPQILNTFGDSLPATIIDDGEMQANIKMVDGQMQSENFEEGVSGWQILPNGDVEFAQGTFRGALIVTKGDGSYTKIDGGDIEIYDSSGNLVILMES